MDSCDDNESDRHSQNSNDSQRCLRHPPICQKTTPPTTMASATRNASNNNYHHKHMVGSASTTTSPINVLSNFNDSNSNSQQNLINNLHLLSQSPAPRNTTPNYLNIIPNGGNGNMLRSSTGHMIDQQISNLDLINGVENNSTIAALHRQMRIRGYGNSKSKNMIRHETKL